MKVLVLAMGLCLGTVWLFADETFEATFSPAAASDVPRLAFGQRTG